MNARYRKTRTAVVLSGLVVGISACMVVHAAIPSSSSTSPSTTYKSPSEVLGVAIAGDSPGSMWYYPTNVARTTHEVYTWLKQARPVRVTMPKSDVGFTADYAGPAQLSFTDENGSHIWVYPAYYLADGHKNAYGGPITKRFPYPGVVAYENGSHTVYVKAPGLYRWLKTDAWEKQSVIEAYTPEERQAMEVVSATRWHWLFRGLFVPVPGPAIRDLPHGGPLSFSHSALRGTCATYVSLDGHNILVRLTEEWYNGKAQHTWTFMVSPKGKIIHSTQSGDTAPPLWR